MAVTRVFKGPFTVDDYYRMAECGILREGSRVELIDGQVVPMNPIGSHHASRVKYLNATLGSLLGAGAVVSVQDPVRLDRRSEPQPDIAVVRRRANFYSDKHPAPDDVLLIIEVSDSTIDYDRDVKVPLYARAGIPEVWLADLAGDGLDVYRDPTPDGYRDVRRLKRGGMITALHLPEVTLPVADVLG